MTLGILSERFKNIFKIFTDESYQIRTKLEVSSSHFKEKKIELKFF